MTLLMLDFGGGTFDCSFIRVSLGIIDFQSYKGNNLLGGVDLD